MHLIGTHFGTYEVHRDAAGKPVLAPFAGDPAPSAIGPGLLEMAAHPLRIPQPMARAGWWHGTSGGEGRGREPFIPVPWDTALNRLADELKRVIARHGNSAIFAGSYGWASAGRFHHAQSQLKRALNLLGGFTTSVNTYSYGTAGVLLPHILGSAQRDACDTAPYWDDIAAACQLMVAFGGFRPGNAQVEAGGSTRHRVRQWLDEAVANGCRIVVLSPDGGDVPPGLKAEHIPLRPNTDTALLLAMAHVLLEEELLDHALLQSCTVGFEAFEGYLRAAPAKSPEWAEAICGVPAATIRVLARAVAATRSTLTLAWSLQRARFGEQPYWAAIALAAMAGQIGKPGGGIAFGLGAVGSVGNPVRRLQGPALPQGRNPVPHVIPVARITELLENPGGMLDYNGRRIALPDIRLVWWAGGNPFHHHQDLHRLARAWMRPETVVVQDHVWTASARRADLVLPSALPIERNDIAASSRDNAIVFSRAIAQPPGGVRTDHAALADLLSRFGLRDAFTEDRDEMGWLEHLYTGYRARHPELPDFETFSEEGVAWLEGPPEPADPRHRLRRFVADPDGAPLDTPSGRIEISTPRIASFGYADCPSHPAWLPPEEWLGAERAARFPIHLLSPQPEGRLHSQLDPAAASRAGKRDGREVVRLNPQDCTARGIAAGDTVRLFNDRGALLAVAQPDAALMPGVASLPTGAWLDLDESGLERHGNPNVLTPDIGSSRLSQGPSPNSCLVQVARWDGPAAPPRAFAPPAILEETAP